MSKSLPRSSIDGNDLIKSEIWFSIKGTRIITVIKDRMRKDIYIDNTALVRCKLYFSDTDFTIPSNI